MLSGGWASAGPRGPYPGALGHSAVSVGREVAGRAVPTGEVLQGGGAQGREWEAGCPGAGGPGTLRQGCSLLPFQGLHASCPGAEAFP